LKKYTCLISRQKRHIFKKEHKKEHSFNLFN